MATYSINQVRQFYIVKAVKTGSNLLSTDDAGSILPKGNIDKSVLYFQYMSPGGIESSDKIEVKNILYAKATASDKAGTPLARKEITVNSIVPGEDYTLGILFRNYIGLSEGAQTIKYGMAHAKTGSTASSILVDLALSIIKNTSNVPDPMVTVYLKDATTSTKITKETKLPDLGGTYTSLILEETSQHWSLGTMPETVIPFEVQFFPITVDGEEVPWGTVTKLTPDTILPNGKKVADMEYFYIGERGDVYRGMGFPYTIRTTYLADSSQKYDLLDIHYAYVGSNEAVQKSEKTITLAAPDDGSHTIMKGVIAAINTASGLNIPTL